MESITDPDMLKDRKLSTNLNLFTYDYRKSVVVVGLLACIGMTSLAAMGPNWSRILGRRRLRIN